MRSSLGSTVPTTTTHRRSRQLSMDTATVSWGLIPTPRTSRRTRVSWKPEQQQSQRLTANSSGEHSTTSKIGMTSRPPRSQNSDSSSPSLSISSEKRSSLSSVISPRFCCASIATCWSSFTRGTFVTPPSSTSAATVPSPRRG